MISTTKYNTITLLPNKRTTKNQQKIMSNKDLLKQAIAEAKTIREAAIANAKEALEESITPHLKEMLAQKLQEMEDLGETEDNGTKNLVDGEPTDYDHGNIVSEEEEEDAPEEEEAPEGEETEEEDEELDPEDPKFSEKLKQMVQDLVAQEIGNQTPAEEIPGEEGLENMEDDNTIDIGTDSVDEIDIDELLAELEGMGDDSEEPTYEGKTKMDGMGKPKMEGMGKPKMKKPNPMEEDLNEAVKTVKILRNQLQEVNLLNAKLLYVNKVFKANNLTEGQKVNVIAAFDKAETVREVKLVFETVSKNVVTNKPTSIKEHTSFASKATGTRKTVAPKEIISEVSEQVKRMQKLAGIIK